MLLYGSKSEKSGFQKLLVKFSILNGDIAFLYALNRNLSSTPRFPIKDFGNGDYSSHYLLVLQP